MIKTQIMFTLLVTICTVTLLMRSAAFLHLLETDIQLSLKSVHSNVCFISEGPWIELAIPILPCRWRQKVTPKRW